MEPRTNFYPIYVSGQYLTSEHLNETHNFLWEEEKATRYLLAGNGVAQGLLPDFTAGAVMQTVTLKKGCASTVDGYIIQEASDITFNKQLAVNLISYITADGSKHFIEQSEYNKLTDKSAFLTPTVMATIEVFPGTLAANDLPEGAKTIDQLAITSADALSKYILLAWVGIKDLENSQCQQGDCNTKGMQRNYRARYFLVLNTLFSQLNVLNAQLPTCGVARIKKIADSGSKAGLITKSFAAWSVSYAELLAYFTDGSGKQLMLVANLLDADDKAAFTTSFNNLKNINASVSGTVCPQYYNSFAADLAKAINELVVYYNDYATKYPSFSASRMERVSILGSFRQSGIDKWRYYYVSAPDTTSSHFDSIRLKRLYRRVLAMVDNFITQANIGTKANAVQTKPVAIPTVVGDGLLQDRAIPYYFDIQTLVNNENNILKYWNPQGGNLKNVFCYYDPITNGRSDMFSKLATADWMNDNFFRIEGHIGMNKNTAITAINNLIFNQGLPIQLVDCDVSYKGPQKWITFFDDFKAQLVTWLPNLSKTSTPGKPYTDYDFAPVKKVFNDINQKSYRSVDDVVKLVNNFTAVSGVYHKTDISSGGTVINGLPKTAYTQYRNVIKDTDIVAINKGLKEAIAEQTDVNAKKLVVLSDLTDLEYMGGVPRGGTFVLLHDGTNVIGDGCLGYFYRINQVRVFSAG